MDEYYKFMEEWKMASQDIAKEIYKTVKEMPDDAFGVSKDWIAGYRRDLAGQMIDKAVSPYNYFRDRLIATEKEESIEFVPADQKMGVGEQKRLSWGQEGTATEEKDYFEIKYNDGSTAKVPRSALKEKFNDGGKFYTTRINDIPTNLFPRDDKSNIWNVHLYKPR